MKTFKPLLASLGAVAALGLSSAYGGVIESGFSANTLAGNDDGSTGLVSFGFTNAINFYGTNYTGAYLNNNGNMTFNSAMSTYTPFGLTTPLGQAIIAPFFADVDTRPAASDKMTYGTGTFDGHAAFGQTWTGVSGVGYYNQNVDRLNKFQTLLVDRSDVAAGDFDIYFNYDQIQWDTGDVSTGNPAHAGFSNGSGVAGTYYEFAGSGVNGAFLDSGPSGTALIHNTNVGLDGRYVFQVRSGNVTVPPNTVPDSGSTAMLIGLALAGLIAARRKAA